jgi:hypothetical protein
MYAPGEAMLRDVLHREDVALALLHLQHLTDACLAVFYLDASNPSHDQILVVQQVWNQLVVEVEHLSLDTPEVILSSCDVNHSFDLQTRVHVMRCDVIDCRL